MRFGTAYWLKRIEADGPVWLVHPLIKTHEGVAGGLAAFEQPVGERLGGDQEAEPVALAELFEDFEDDVIGSERVGTELHGGVGLDRGCGFIECLKLFCLK